MPSGSRHTNQSKLLPISNVASFTNTQLRITKSQSYSVKKLVSRKRGSFPKRTHGISATQLRKDHNKPSRSRYRPLLRSKLFGIVLIFILKFGSFLFICLTCFLVGNKVKIHNSLLRRFPSFRILLEFLSWTPWIQSWKKRWYRHNAFNADSRSERVRVCT